jgi:hypothetical protein
VKVNELTEFSTFKFENSNVKAIKIGPESVNPFIIILYRDILKKKFVRLSLLTKITDLVQTFQMYKIVRQKATTFYVGTL